MSIPFNMQSQFLFGNNDKRKEMEKACNDFTDQFANHLTNRDVAFIYSHFEDSLKAKLDSSALDTLISSIKGEFKIVYRAKPKTTTKWSVTNADTIHQNTFKIPLTYTKAPLSLLGDLSGTYITLSVSCRPDGYVRINDLNLNRSSPKKVNLESQYKKLLKEDDSVKVQYKTSIVYRRDYSTVLQYEIEEIADFSELLFSSSSHVLDGNFKTDDYVTISFQSSKLGKKGWWGRSVEESFACKFIISKTSNIGVYWSTDGFFLIDGSYSEKIYSKLGKLISKSLNQ